MISASRTMRTVVFVASLGLFAPLAWAGETISLATASNLIEHASYQSGGSATAELTKIVQALTAQRGSSGSSAKYVDYYIGYANYALAQNYLEQDHDKAGAYLDKAEAALQGAIKADPDFAEAHALLASVYGLEISVNPMRGMQLGGRIANQMNRATALAPHNPRTTLIRAFSDYYTPSMFGGSKPRAMQELGQAIEQFDHFKPPNAFAPTWGKAETYALRADCEAAAGHTTAARHDYQAALALAPDYAYVKSALAKLQAKVPAGAAPKARWSGN